MCVCLAVEDLVNRRPWFLDFFYPSGCYILPVSSSVPRSEWKDMMDTSYLVLKMPRSFTDYILSSCESLCLFSSTEGRCLSDEGWGRHWPINLTKCRWKSFYFYLLLAEWYNLIFSQCQVLSGLKSSVTWAGLRLNSSSWSGPQIQSYMGWSLLQTCTTIELGTHRLSVKTKGCVADYLPLWQQKVGSNEHGEEKRQWGQEYMGGHLTKGHFRDHTEALCSKRLRKYIQAKAT